MSVFSYGIPRTPDILTMAMVKLQKTYPGIVDSLENVTGFVRIANLLSYFDLRIFSETKNQKKHPGYRSQEKEKY